MKFIARARTQWICDARIALNGRHEAFTTGSLHPSAREHEILIERRFEGAGIGSPQYSIGRL